jgi:hypothetical protein
MTVPNEFSEDTEFEREPESGLEEAPMRTKLRLEVSRET